MQSVSFTHANMNTEVVIMRELAFAVYYSPHHKSTMVVSTGGAVLPVKEAVDVVCSKLGIDQLTTEGNKNNV